ncbi:hypothetical protein GCM10010872_30600 [Dyella flava]|nr:hypothetical protein GCM10010872_30600 [Dyella flava]
MGAGMTKFLVCLAAALLVCSGGVYGEDDSPPASTDAGGGAGAGGGFGGGVGDVTQGQPVNVTANRAPDPIIDLGGSTFIGMSPSQYIGPPLQVSKSPGGVPTLARVTVNANVDQTKSPCDPQPTGGDPVDLSSGTKVESVTDFAVPGEMGLQFTRYYSSNYYSPSSYYNQGTNTRLGVWTTSFDYVLMADLGQSNCQLFVPNSVCPMVLIHPDGSIVQFSVGTVNADGSASFNELHNGIATLTRNSDGSYVVHDEDSKVLTYSNQLVNAWLGEEVQLSSVKDQAGVGWTFTYPNTTTTVVTHTSGRTVTLSTSFNVSEAGSDTVNRQLTVTDPAGNTYTYGMVDPSSSVNYTEPGFLIGELRSATLPGSPATTVSYTYNDGVTGGPYLWALTGVAYNGVLHDQTSYNSQGQAVQTQMADGTQQTSISYSSNSTGSVATVTNPLGHVSVYQFNTKSDLVSITGQASAHCAATLSSRTYDANENVSSETDNDGNVVDYTYAANGEIQQKIESPGAYQRVTNFVWDSTPATDRLLSVTVVGYLQTTFTYTAQGRLASVTQTNLTSNGVANQSQTTTYRYALNSNGMASSVTTTYPSLNGANTVTYSYDAYGDVTGISNALGQATTYSNLTGLGLPQTTTSPNGNVVDYTYDARGRLTTFSHTYGGVTNTGGYKYDPNSGQISEYERPDGEITTYAYDADFKLTSSTWTGPSGAAVVTSNTYDANGDVTGTSWTRQGISSPDLVTSTSYDELGRPIVINGNHGQSSTLTYDPNGNVSTVTNAAGNTTTYKYDSDGRPEYVTDPAGHTTVHEYDYGNQSLQTTDPRGLVTKYARDGFGQLWTLTSPDTGTTSYAYDAYGHLTSKTTNDGNSVTYTYDTLNRLTSAAASGQTFGYTYTYDSCTYGVGHLCGFSDSTGTTSYTYDIMGDVASRTWSNGLFGTSTTSYAYDGIRRLVQISEGGVYVVDYSWVDDQVGSVAVQFNGQSATVLYGAKYNAMRQPLGWTWGGTGIQRTLTYDNDGRLTSISSMNGSSAIQSQAYTWNDLDLITGINNEVYSTITQNYTYDNLNRLTNQSGPAPLALTYDANGNRASQVDSGTEAITIASTSNHLLTRGENTYSYNANGNVSMVSYATSGTNVTYSYDGFGRLSSAVRSGAASICETNGDCPAYPAGTTSYVNNALGQRKWLDGPESGFQIFSYGLSGELSSEATVAPGSNTANINYYVYFDGQPVALINDESTLYYLHDDHLGRPEEITNTNGSMVWLGLNYAFDRSILVQGIQNVDIGLPGQVYDSNTGNWSNGFRDYDSSDGRYLESDLIGLGGGVNTYAYVGGNPTASIDPSGLRADTDLCAGLTAQGCMQMAQFGPDYVTLNVTVPSVFEFGGTITRAGTVFQHGGFALGSPKSTASGKNWGFNLSIGYLLTPCPGTNAGVNGFVDGPSKSFSYYNFVGGGIVHNGSGTAIEMGVGLGGASGGGSYAGMVGQIGPGLSYTPVPSP